MNKATRLYVLKHSCQLTRNYSSNSELVGLVLCRSVSGDGHLQNHLCTHAVKKIGNASYQLLGYNS
jgi:hypothetical protein